MYVRATREVSFDALDPAIVRALSDHAAANQLRLDGLRVWLTHSQNPPATRLFGKLLGRRANSLDPDVEHDTVLLLHATHLLVATSGAKRGISVLSLPLARASVTWGSKLAARLGAQVGLPELAGMSLNGFPADHGEVGSYFFGLGPEPAASACFRAVEAAIVAAKNPG